MPVSVSALRQNIFKLLDEVLSTGNPLKVLRKGKFLIINTSEPMDKLKNLKKRKLMRNNPQEYVHLDWSGEWKP